MTTGPAFDRQAEEAIRLHARYRGKVQVLPKCPVRGMADLAVWYTPGVAAPCRAIAADPEAVWELTNRGNAIAVVSDGTRVLGLGDIGPIAGLPVMEGKALLFKYLGGVDAVPLCLATRNAEEVIRAVEVLQPSFGGVNLEDIAQPKCFTVLDRLRSTLDIAVWHDDQQGSATVLLAGVLNALRLIGKGLASVRFALVGFGAANVSVYRILKASGADPGAIVACDSRGTLHPARHDIEEQSETVADKWLACRESNADRVVGGVAEALRGADVCIAFSRPGPGTIAADWVAAMNPDAVVFACANPVPEIWPDEARAAGARIVATGRCDLPNQVNNSLGFPGIFRGVLDVRASRITDGMALAAAHELARYAVDRHLDESHLLPTMEEWEVFPLVAAATGMAAQEEGVAQLKAGADELHERARRIIAEARQAAVRVNPGTRPGDCAIAELMSRAVD